MQIDCAGLFTLAAQLPQKLRAACCTNPQEVQAAAPGFIRIPQFVQRLPYEGVNDISISSNPPSTSLEAPTEAISTVATDFSDYLGVGTQISVTTTDHR